eukprot:m.23428 g.23428  ORF g.23428 m.23428 type:complete len:105 (-) comp7499_c0_seq1:743-1057(-)
MLYTVISSTRPWSFTASIVPVLVTAAASGANLLSSSVLRAVCFAVSVHAGANLTNTYYDYKKGIDNQSSLAKGTGHETLVNKQLTPNTVLGSCSLMNISYIMSS